MQTLVRALCFYTAVSLLEVGILYLRVSGDTEAKAPLAADFAAKLFVLLAASAVFGVSFGIFRFRHLPAPAKRLLHILVCFAPVVMVVQSMVGDGTEPDMQSYVFFYFFAVLVYLAVYGGCMLVRFIIRRKRLPK